jgi:thioredoxin 1
MKVTDDTFKQEVSEFDGVVLVDFWAAWCGPCLMLEPTIEEIANDYEENKKVKVLKLNVDENQQTAQQFQVMSIPTTILFKDGNPVKSIVGVRGKQDYVSAIDEALE